MTNLVAGGFEVCEAFRAAIEQCVLAAPAPGPSPNVVGGESRPAAGSGALPPQDWGG